MVDVPRELQQHGSGGGGGGNGGGGGDGGGGDNGGDGDGEWAEMRDPPGRQLGWRRSVPNGGVT